MDIYRNIQKILDANLKAHTERHTKEIQQWLRELDQQYPLGVTNDHDEPNEDDTAAKEATQKDGTEQP